MKLKQFNFTKSEFTRENVINNQKLAYQSLIRKVIKKDELNKYEVKDYIKKVSFLI